MSSTSSSCYFTSSVEGLHHTSGAQVPQFHLPHLPAIGPGCCMNRTRAPNAVETALFKTARFFKSKTPDDLYIFYPNFTSADASTPFFSRNMTAFKSAIEELVPVVQDSLKKEFEATTTAAQTEPISATAENGGQSSTPYFGATSMRSYKCNVSFLPPEIDAEQNRQAYLGQLAFVNIVRCIGAGHERMVPSGTIFYINVSKLCGGNTDAQTKLASLKQLIGYLSSIHMVGTRFNGKAALEDIVARDPLNAKKGERDWFVEKMIEVQVKKEVKRRKGTGEWIVAKDEDGEVRNAERMAWYNFMEKYGVLFSPPIDGEEAAAAETEIENSDKRQSHSPLDQVFNEKDAAQYQNYYQGDLLKERADFLNCYSFWKNFVEFGEFKCPSEDRPVVFAFDVAGIPEAQATHAQNSVFEGEVRGIAALLHSALKEPVLSHFVRVDSSLGPKCAGINSLVRFSLDCMNRIRPIDEDQQQKQ